MALKNKVITIVIVFTILLIVFLLKYMGLFNPFVFMSLKSDPVILEKVYLENSEDFQKIAENFIKSGLGGIQVNVDNDNSICEYFGGWTKCPNSIHADNRWYKSNPIPPNQRESEERYIYLNNLDDVLSEVDISKNEYDKYVDFLRKYHLNRISINSLTQKREGIVMFEYMLSGLRYESDLNDQLLEDDEYQYVKRINNHWYVYERDWN